MTLYADYLNEIDTRKEQGLSPKPIEDAELLSEVISNVMDADSEHREASLNFFVYNTLPGTTSAAGEKAKFLKQIILGECEIQEIVRRHGFLDRPQLELSEYLAHLFVDVKRPACGIASAVR